MPDLQNCDSLSFGDALFLYLERSGMPLHIASISIFEGAIPLPACTRFVESKLPAIPRYCQRVVIPPLNIGLPVWEYDPTFDLRNHVRQIVLKRGGEAEFKAAVATVLSANMDRSRPLWDVTLVSGLNGNRTGLITRLHHCLADGLAGIGMMNALMDATPDARVPARRPVSQPAPPRRATPELLDNVITACFSAVKQVLTAQSELLSIAQHVVAAAGKEAEPEAQLQSNGSSDEHTNVLDQWTGLLPELAEPVKRLPFNVVCRGPQKFHWAEISTSEIKAVRHAYDATFNDVAMAAMAATVRRYAELHGVRVSGRLLRIVVPVSVRSRSEAGEAGNRISFLPVSIPLDIRNPRELVVAVRERMARLKNAKLAGFVGFAGTLIGAIPTPLQALIGPIASQLPLSICNLIFTNVRGPDAPMYLLGHEMLACYPYVPIGGEMGMNCALLTYNGTAYFGFTADVNAVPDAKKFEKLLTVSFAELRKSAGAVASQPKPRRRKAKPPAPQPLAAAEVTQTPPEPAAPTLAKAAVA